MALNLFHILSFLTLALVTSHAALSPELYWKQQLPNTEMPQSIREMLYPEFLDDKSTSVVVGKGGVGVDAGKGKPGRTTVGVGKGGVGVNAGGGTQVGVGKGGVGVSTGKPGRRTNVGVGKGGVGVSTGKPGRRTNVGVGKGGVSVHTGHKGKPVYVGVKPGPDPFIYLYEASETQLHHDPNVAHFFLQKDLQQGNTMTLRFTKTTTNQATFLPRKVADTIPFSSKNFPEILNRFSVNPQSTEAEVMKNTIKECEEGGIQGEEKYCATSLENIVDYSKSKLGNDVKVISTEVSKETNKLQNYKVEGVVQVSGDRETKYEVCHKLNYAYAVFYCHKTENTKAFLVPLKGEDGTQVKAVAVCHTNTSQWNPKHLAFKVLGVKPGTVPICHFLPQDHLVWYNN